MTPRKASIGRVEMVSVGCCWKGCEEKHIYPEGTVTVDGNPEGWREVLFTKGSHYYKKFVMDADVGGLLCPKHYRELLGYLQTGESILRPRRRGYMHYRDKERLFSEYEA